MPLFIDTESNQISPNSLTSPKSNRNLIRTSIGERSPSVRVKSTKNSINKISSYPFSGDLHSKLSNLQQSLADEIKKHEFNMSQLNELSENGGVTRGLDNNILSPSLFVKKRKNEVGNDEFKTANKDRTSFLKAALQLLDERDEVMEEEQDLADPSSRMTSPRPASTKNSTNLHTRSSSSTSPLFIASPSKRSLIPSPETNKEDNVVLRSGMLKKGKDSSIYRFKFKFVVLVGSALMWFPNKLAYADFEKENINKKTTGGNILHKNQPPSIIIDSYAECERAETAKYLNRHIFILWNNRDLSSRRLWMCKTEEECDEWLLSIRKCIENAKSKGGEDNHDIDKIEKVQAMMAKVEKEEDYTNILLECSKKDFNVPVAWIHQTKYRPLVAKDPGLEQVFKDLGRDRVQIDGLIFEPNGEDDVAPKVIGALLHKIIENGAEWNMSASQALALARDTLLCCNRTESSGDAYEAVMTLFNNPDYVAICPSSLNAAPIKFVIRKGKYESPWKNDPLSPPPSTQNRPQHRRSITSPEGSIKSNMSSPASSPLRIKTTFGNRESMPYIRVQANTDYRLCCLEDMTKVYGEVHASFRHVRYFDGGFSSVINVSLTSFSDPDL